MSVDPLWLTREYGVGLEAPTSPTASTAPTATQVRPASTATQTGPAVTATQTGPAVTAPPAAPSIPKLEPQWRAVHRLQAGLKLTIVAVTLGLLLAAVLGAAATAAIVFLNDTTVSHSSTTSRP